MTDKPDSAALDAFERIIRLFSTTPPDQFVSPYDGFEGDVLQTRQALQREVIPADERISEYEAYKVLQNMTKGFTDAKPWQLICRIFKRDT